MKDLTNENSEAICEKIIAYMDKEFGELTPDEIFQKFYLLLTILLPRFVKELKNPQNGEEIKKAIQEFVDDVLQGLPTRKEEKTMEYPMNETSAAIWDKVIDYMDKERDKVTYDESFLVFWNILNIILQCVVQELKNFHTDEEIKKIIQAMMDIGLRDEYEPPEWIS